MMKTLFSFLFVFLFLLGFGQSKNIDTISYNEKYCEKNYEVHRKIEKEFENVNFSDLYLKIIADIDFSKIKERNLIFHYEPLNEWRGISLSDEIKCSYNHINAFYNQSNFWNVKTINFFLKRYHKNMIPYLKGIGFVIENKEDEPTFEEQGYYFKESKALIIETKKQAKGLFIEESEGYKANNINEKVFFEKRTIFYYFPNKKQNLILKNKKGANENYSTLFLEFTNRSNKTVVVKFEYNLDESLSKEEDRYYKTYRYQNKTWVEIPTKQEHEF